MKYHLKAEIYNVLHVIDSLMLHLQSCSTSSLLACCVNVMTRQRQHRCINYRSDSFCRKLWHFWRFSAAEAPGRGVHVDIIFGLH